MKNAICVPAELNFVTPCATVFDTKMSPAESTAQFQGYCSAGVPAVALMIWIGVPPAFGSCTILELPLSTMYTVFALSRHRPSGWFSAVPVVLYVVVTAPLVPAASFTTRLLPQSEQRWYRRDKEDGGVSRQ